MRNQILNSALDRIAGVRSISAELDLGIGLSVETYQSAISEVEVLLNSYNTQLASLGELRNRIKEKEMVLKDYNERILIGVGAKFGKDSNQYQMAGGTKKSMRKRPRRKPNPDKVAE